MSRILENLLDVSEPMSKTEEDIVIETFNKPEVIRYLKRLGREDLIQLSALSVTESLDSSIAKKHAVIQGRLSVITTLLSISTK